VNVSSVSCKELCVKVKYSKGVPVLNHHEMKMYGRVEVKLLSFLTYGKMEVSGHATFIIIKTDSFMELMNIC
jgi:hypothetical protein